jgi:hypothetical protein
MLVSFVVIRWISTKTNPIVFSTDLQSLRTAFSPNTPQFQPYEGGSGIHGLLCVANTDFEAIQALCSRHSFEVLGRPHIQQIDDVFYTPYYTPSPLYYQQGNDRYCLE